MKYFYLISSLPDVEPEDRSFSQENLEQLIDLIARNLAKEDQAAFRALLAPGDHQNLLYLLFREYHDFEIVRFKSPAAIEVDLIENYRRNYAFFPDYIIHYLNDFSGSFASMSLQEMEQKLEAYFFDHLEHLDSPFLSTYFQWRTRLKQTIADLNVRGFKFLQAPQHTDIHQFSNAITLHGLTSFDEVANQIQPLIEANDLQAIEAKINTYYWEFASCWQQPFTSEQVFAYLIKIIRMHRWKGFTMKGAGAKEKFETLIMDLKERESSPKMPLI